MRLTWLWLGLTGSIFIGLAIWAGIDVYQLMERGSSANPALRVLYLLLSETDKPVLQVGLGCLAASLVSWRMPGQGNPLDEPSEKPNLS